MLETLIKRDRMVVLGGLILVIILAWAYILAGAGMNMDAAMAVPDSMNMMASSAGWTPGYSALMFTMWWVMMMAMMLPSAAPMILLFATVNRGAAKTHSRSVPTFVFAAGYVMIWGFFSLVATFIQWALASSLLLDNMMQSNSHLLSGAILISAGAYQFLPVKDACLRNCQTPMQFVMGHWSPGQTGALKMGVLHGTFCLGCCWFLMALLFFGGVMNLIWIGGLALYVLFEKLAPPELFISKIAGGVLFAWGVATVWAA
jgi:predicted metal-binding membrane protein